MSFTPMLFTLEDFRHFVSRVMRACVAAFSGATAGVFAASAVPVLIFRLPPSNVFLPPDPALVLTLTLVMTAFVPFSFWLPPLRRPSLRAYVDYAAAMSCLMTVGMAFAAAPAGTRVPSGTMMFDLVWILLTETLPAAVTSGSVAYTVMTIGARGEQPPPETGLPA